MSAMWDAENPWAKDVDRMEVREIYFGLISEMFWYITEEIKREEYIEYQDVSREGDMRLYLDTYNAGHKSHPPAIPT